MPVTVQNLIAGRIKPACVSDDAGAKDALQLMLAHDYSQLPVVNSNEELVGMITSDSIARALNLLGLKVQDLKVSNATDSPRRYKLDSELSELLDGLRDVYAVPVVDNFNRVIGIVTNYDTAAYFRSRAEDMMLVEDVETMLKDCIRVDLIGQQGRLDDSELTATVSADLGIRPFDRLTFNDYLLLFIHKNRWNRFSASIDLPRDACRIMLEAVKDVRNDLFHFRTDISAERRFALIYCRDWLNRYQQTIMDALGPGLGSEVQLTTIGELAGQKGTSPEAITSQVEALAESPQLIEKVTPETSKYEGVATFLQTLPQHVDNVQISFEEFESIIESNLPRSAYEHRSWWANDSVGHIQSRQWLEVGWRVSSVNISQRKATFSRIQDREQKYIAFFSELITQLRDAGLDMKTLSPTGKSFLPMDNIVGKDGNQITFISSSFARGGRFRVELYIDTGSFMKNDFIFEGLKSIENRIQNSISSPLEWESLNDKRACRIAAYHPGSITDSEQELHDLQMWATSKVREFYQLFQNDLRPKIIELEVESDRTDPTD